MAGTLRLSSRLFGSTDRNSFMWKHRGLLASTTTARGVACCNKGTFM